MPAYEANSLKNLGKKWVEQMPRSPFFSAGFFLRYVAAARYLPQRGESALPLATSLRFLQRNCITVYGWQGFARKRLMEAPLPLIFWVILPVFSRSPHPLSRLHEAVHVARVPDGDGLKGRLRHGFPHSPGAQRVQEGHEDRGGRQAKPNTRKSGHRRRRPTQADQGQLMTFSCPALT